MSSFPEYRLDDTDPTNDIPPNEGQMQVAGKTIAEMGFTTSNMKKWDEVEQPPKPNLLDLMQKMVRNFEKTDVTILIDNSSFKCHMLVLQCYSNFFLELNEERIIVLPSKRVWLIY